MKRLPNSSAAFDPDDTEGAWIGVLPDSARETAAFDAGAVQLLTQQHATLFRTRPCWYTSTCWMGSLIASSAMEHLRSAVVRRL